MFKVQGLGLIGLKVQGFVPFRLGLEARTPVTVEIQPDWHKIPSSMYCAHET